MKPLFIPLKTRYFRAFQRGEKTTEYRLYGPRWHEGTCYAGRPVTLSHGYSGARLTGIIEQMRIIRNSVTDLYPRGCYLAAIDIADISE